MRAAVRLIVQFHKHPDSDVRFNLAFALGCYPDDRNLVRSEPGSSVLHRSFVFHLSEP